MYFSICTNLVSLSPQEIVCVAHMPPWYIETMVHIRMGIFKRQLCILVKKARKKFPAANKASNSIK